ncbi:MAG: hypothetical protein QXF26_07865, partial [Candidatus Bathyarchaeia archaeon]
MALGGAMGKRFFDELEAMDRKEREAYQTKRLKEAVERAYRNARAIRELFDKNGIRPEDIGGPRDMERLPIIRKTDVIELQKRYP